MKKTIVILLHVLCFSVDGLYSMQEKNNEYCLTIPNGLPLSCNSQRSFQDGKYKQDLTRLEAQILTTKYCDELKPNIRKCDYNSDYVYRSLIIDPYEECLKCMHNLAGMVSSAKNDTDKRVVITFDQVVKMVYKHYVTLSPTMHVALEYATSDGVCNGFENVIKPGIIQLIPDCEKQFDEIMKKNVEKYNTLHESEKKRIMPFMYYALQISKQEMDERLFRWAQSKAE